MIAPIIVGIVLVITLIDYGRLWFPGGFWGLPVTHPYSIALGSAVALLMWGVVLFAAQAG